jgi:hypothetical protein
LARLLVPLALMFSVCGYLPRRTLQRRPILILLVCLAEIFGVFILVGCISWG